MPLWDGVHRPTGRRPPQKRDWTHRKGSPAATVAPGLRPARCARGRTRSSMLWRALIAGTEESEAPNKRLALLFISSRVTLGSSPEDQSLSGFLSTNNSVGYTNLVWFIGDISTNSETTWSVFTRLATEGALSASVVVTNEPRAALRCDLAGCATRLARLRPVTHGVDVMLEVRCIQHRHVSGIRFCVGPAYPIALTPPSNTDEHTRQREERLVRSVEGRSFHGGWSMAAELRRPFIQKFDHRRQGRWITCQVLTGGCPEARGAESRSRWSTATRGRGGAESRDRGDAETVNRGVADSRKH